MDRTPQDTTAKEIIARFSDLENNPEETIRPYREFKVGGKFYYFTPGGFLYRREPGTQEVGGCFCGYLTTDIWHYRADVEPEGVDAPPDGAELRPWWRRFFGY